MNEITIFEGRKLDKVAKSGNARLDKISNEIMSEMNKANALFTEVQAKTEAYARACAPLFGEVKRDKLYEKGGYKSLEEYAAVFGVQKSTAYAWARVGEAFFLEDNEHTRKIRETLTMSNMAELTNTDRVQLAAAIDNKDITKDTAQKDIREFATSHRKDGKTKERVLPTFTVSEYPSKAIIAENVSVQDNVKLGVGEEVPNETDPHIYNNGLVTIGEKSVIPEGVSVGKNSVVAGITAVSDYPDGELGSGKTLIKAGD